MIVRERPMIEISGEEIGLQDVNDPSFDVETWLAVEITNKSRVIKQKYDALPAYEQKLFNNLSDTQTHCALQKRKRTALVEKGRVSQAALENAFDFIDAKKSLQGVFASNCMARGDDANIQVLCPAIARFNHSCCPNAMVTRQADENVVVATKDIEEGISFWYRRFEVVVGQFFQKKNASIC